MSQICRSSVNEEEWPECGWMTVIHRVIDWHPSEDNEGTRTWKQQQPTPPSSTFDGKDCRGMSSLVKGAGTKF